MKSVLSFIIVTFAVVAYGDVVHKYTPEERAAQREKFRTVTGGFIYDKRDAGVSVAIVDAQGVVDKNFLQKRAEYYGNNIYSKVIFCSTNKVFVADLNALGAMVQSLGAKAGVFMIESDELPSLIVLPGAMVSVVNVKALKNGVTDNDKFLSRVRKEMTRGVAFALGIGYSDKPGGPLSPGVSVAGLDSILADGFASDSIMAITKALDRMGVKRYKRATYLKACEEGWAPQPIDDYQRKIWQDVHKMPTKPLTIEPEKVPVEK